MSSDVGLEKIELWAEEGRPVGVFLCVPRKDQNAGEVYIRQLNFSEQVKRAGKYWGICWLIALASVFIPIAHFILVPLFLIAGPTIGLIKFGQKTIILGGRGQCPSCQTEIMVDSTPEKWPLQEVCYQCGTEISINAKT